MIDLDRKKGKEMWKERISPIFQELLDFLWQHQNHKYSTHPFDAALFAPTLKRPRPAASLPGLTSV
jgi:hypothetical protein